MRYCPQCYVPALGAVAVCEKCDEEFLEIPDLPYVEESGFSHPEWEKYYPIFDTQVSEVDSERGWNILTHTWLSGLVCDLGGAYRLYESKNILLVSDAVAEEAQALLSFAQRSLEHLRPLLSPEFRDVFAFQAVVLSFGEHDDYYDYVSHYYPEGNFPNNVGLFIRHGFYHVALAGGFFPQIQRTMAHELTHYAFARLPLPSWLNEALAMGVERMMVSEPFELDQETADRLREFWTEDNIQMFWSGESWHIPGDASELSYLLAQVLWQQLRTRGESLAAFIYAADYNDAGQDAALKHLGFGLETLVEEFLGPGDWRPNRRKLAESFQRAQDKSSASE